MNKRLIVLTDLSESSSDLVQYADNWATDQIASLVLLHQTMPVIPGMIEKKNKDTLLKLANEEELKKLKKLKQSLTVANKKIVVRASEKNLVNQIREFLADPFEHIIVIGLKQPSGFFKKFVWGGTAIQVIENSQAIVAHIPKGLSQFSLNRIFVGITQKHPVNILALNSFFDFFEKLSISVTFFYWAQPQEDTAPIEKILLGLTRLFAHKFQTSFHVYRSTQELQSLQQVITNEEQDLLVIQKGSRLLTDQLFRKYLINELVHQGTTPFVVLP